ncbi:MAG: hypothetical protein H2069_05345 [Legionella sp.]|nr:hypothetical protein [Legionella sp.]
MSYCNRFDVTHSLLSRDKTYFFNLLMMLIQSYLPAEPSAASATKIIARFLKTK